MTVDPVLPDVLATRVTVAHDYFTQRGGAERVVSAIVEAIAPDRLVTAVIDHERTFDLASTPVSTTFLQHLAVFRADPRRALALLPLAWRLMPPVRDGLLICSSSGWSHRLRAAPGVPKIVYCHNPARWIYQTGDYATGLPRAILAILRVLRPALRRGDLAAARSASVYLANSQGVADRIRAAYGIEAIVLHPPVSLDRAGPRTRPHAVTRAGFFLTIARDRGYKHTEDIVDAFRHVPDSRLVVVGNVAQHDVPSNVDVIGRVTDAELRWLYANARALVSVSAEDFGLTPVEANSFGTPALVVRGGGFVESTVEHVSGEFIDDPTIAGIAEAVRTFPREWDTDPILRHSRRFSRNAFIGRLGAVIAEFEGGPGATSGSAAPAVKEPPMTDPADELVSEEPRWR